MSDSLKRVRVKFLDSIAGLRDPSQQALEAKYTSMAEGLAAEKQGKVQRHTPAAIKTLVDVERRKDEAVIRVGFTKDWAFKTGDETSVNEEIARHWEEQGLAVVLSEPVKKAA